MIRKFLSRVFSRKQIEEAAVTGPAQPRIYPRDEHGISRDRISRCALRVTTQLREAGYKAYVVGGAVRDLLLGHEPKDFDVATDATPEQVRRVIRRSRIIGRRFQLVHAMCGDETVEVSTFRAVQQGNGEGDDRHTDEHGRLLRDNVFGDMEDDAVRRDFTINAMFFDPATEEVWDYHNGLPDCRARLVRMIGDPVTRFREDPVRLLRAVRFAGKLDFEIEPSTRVPIAELAPLLANVPEARLFDEMLKLLLSGHSLQCVHLLRGEGLHHGMLPLLDVILEQPLGERFVNLALQTTDARIAADKPVSPGFLFAALLWHEVLANWERRQEAGEKPIPSLNDAMDEVLEQQKQKIAIPRRFDTVMKEIWVMQPRFLQRSGGRPARMLENPRFRAAYDFLRLRCESGELADEVGLWWEQFQEADDEGRRQMLLPEVAPRKRSRRRGRGRSGEAGAAGAATEDGGTPAPSGMESP